MDDHRRPRFVGAIVASLVAGWTVYRDVVQRPRLRADCALMVTMPGREQVIVWTLTNLGMAPLFVTHLVGWPERKSRTRLLLHRLGIWRHGGMIAFAFNFDALYGKKLPVEIAPLNAASLMYPFKPADLPEDFPVKLHDVKRFFAVTADGREWEVPRKRIKVLKAEMQTNRVAQAED